MSVPRALLLVLALLQAAGICDLVRRERCEAACEGNGCNDGTAGDDAPQCPCHCPSAPVATRPAAAAVAVAPATRATELSFERADRAHVSPDPREIQHVPRPRAA